MPAIRYRNSNAAGLIQQVLAGKLIDVDIRLNNGGTAELRWLGFICHAGTRHMPEGHYAKMEALEVTAGDGIQKSKWEKVGVDKAVLCWRMPYEGKSVVKWGVYGIVDSSGCPILVEDKKKPPPPRKTAEIKFLQDVRVKSSIAPNKRA